MILFPGISLEQVLRFDDRLLLPLRASKNWTAPASPAWLGSALCALAAAVGPMARLFLPDGLTLSPMFSAIVGLRSGGASGYHERILEPLRELQRRLAAGRKPLDTFLVRSFEDKVVGQAFRRTANGGILVVDDSGMLLRKLLKGPPEVLDYAPELLLHFGRPIPTAQLAEKWEGAVSALLAFDRERLSDLAKTPLFAEEPVPPVLVLPEDWTHADIPCGHGHAELDTRPWKELVVAVTGHPRPWAFGETRKMACSEEAAAVLASFRAELRDVLKAVDPSFRSHLEWLPDLAGSVAATLCFAGDSLGLVLKPATMEHAVLIVKWLANGHYQGLQEVFGGCSIPDAPDSTAFPDISRRILTRLRQRGAMSPRDLTRSLGGMAAPARNAAIDWLVDRKLAVWTSDRRVRTTD